MLESRLSLFYCFCYCTAKVVVDTLRVQGAYAYVRYHKAGRLMRECALERSRSKQSISINLHNCVATIDVAPDLLLNKS
jgi:hypothetical protein